METSAHAMRMDAVRGEWLCGPKGGTAGYWRLAAGILGTAMWGVALPLVVLFGIPFYTIQYVLHPSAGKGVTSQNKISKGE